MQQKKKTDKGRNLANLMKSPLVSEADAELRKACEYPGIAAVEMGIPHQARVENPLQNRCKSVTDGESAAAEPHLERVHPVLVDVLRSLPDVEPHLVVILLQHPHQVVHEKHCVVIAEDEPSDVRQAETDGLDDDPGDADSRPEALPVRVWKSGSVLGNADRREGSVRCTDGGVEGAVEPDKAPRLARAPPCPDVVPTARPAASGGSNTEDDVARLSGR